MRFYRSIVHLLHQKAKRVIFENKSCVYINPEQLETYGCVISDVATDALELKYQAISIHRAA